jgi:hypothetical protein
MLRRQGNPPGSVFRGNESMRFMTMVVMLGVLFLLIARSGDPNTWTWLTNGTGAVKQHDSIASTGNKNNKEQTSGSSETSVSSQADISTAKLPISSVVTDEDPEEADAAREQFQVIIDGTEKMQPQEMFAYKRVLGWVQNQSFAEMNRRAGKDVVLNKFYQSPDEYRGQLFEFDLTAHLIRDLDEKYNGVELFDIWGTTEESGEWLYNGVIIGLPKGMPIGRNIYEKVTFVGYFFKLQGYQPAGAKANAKSLKAPLFVGRLIWHPVGKPQARSSDWTWGLILLAGFVIFLMIRWGLLLRGGRSRLFSPPTVQANPGGNPVEDWLAKVETDEPDEPAERDNFHGDSDSQPGGPDNPI